MRVLPLCEDDAQPADQAPPLSVHPPSLQIWGAADQREGRPHGEAQQWGLPQPAFLEGGPPSILPGSSDTDLDPELERVDVLPGASLWRKPASELRRTSLGVLGPVLDLQGNIVSHPATPGTGAVQALLKLPRKTFNLRGEMIHVFVSYRVTTEGEAGNGMSGLIVEKIRALSMDRTLQLQLPRHGWGSWPKGLKKPLPFRKEEAKIFLDLHCLQDGQSWLTGFVQGLYLNPTTSTQNPKPQIPSPKPCTLHPAPCNLHPDP